MLRVLGGLAVLCALAAPALADPSPPIDPDDVVVIDADTACWVVPRDSGCNEYGCWSNGGGCNDDGCWNGPSGACNEDGCSDVGVCNEDGCPRGSVRPQIACAAPDDLPTADSGCNDDGCWSNGGGCNEDGCWNTPYGSCNEYGCAKVGACNEYGCPKPPKHDDLRWLRKQHRKHHHHHHDDDDE